MDIKYLLEMLDRAIYPKHSGHDWIEAKKDSEYAFWVEGDKAYLSFQGSYSLTDWIYNLLFLNVPRGKYFVHYGLYAKYKILEKEIENFILTHRDKEFIFTGHSQGAAIALIALVYNYIPELNMKAILFGCPKVFNIISAIALRKIGKNIELVEVKTDIVTKIVPINFRVGKPNKFGNKKIFWKWRVKDHYPRNYRNLMKEKLEIK